MIHSKYGMIRIAMGVIVMRIQRLKKIEYYILEQRTVTIEQICQKFQISVATARRDINSLIKMNPRIVKTFGGVQCLTKSMDVPLTGYTIRVDTQVEEKDRICQKAAEMIAPDDVIFIDTGSTAANLIKYITCSCTVITNSLPVASSAAENSKITLLILPGSLSRNSMAFLGAETCEAIAKFNIQKAFVTSSGVSLSNGLTETTTEEYMIKKNLVERSEKIILMADATKFGKSSLYTYCPFLRLYAFITSDGIDAKVVQYCHDNSIKLFVCSPNAEKEV